MKIFSGIRPGDIVLAVAATALGVVLMFADIHNTEAATRVDSTSWLAIPVFALATLPLLWRRRSMTGVLVVTAAALAVHLLAFGWSVRCGAGLPLAFALAYGSGRLTADRRQSIAELVGIAGIQFLVLAEDSAAGLGILPVTVLISAAFWGAGLWLRQRTVTDPALVAAESPVGVHAGTA